jgi:hypothetical protein
MQSTPNLRETDPHDVFVIEPDVVLAARTDNKAPLDQLYDVLSRSSDPRASDAEVRIAPDFSAAAPSVDATARAGADDGIQLGETEISAHQPATSRFAKRIVMGLFAVGSAFAAAAWQHYGDDATAALASFIPPFTLTSTPPADKPAAAQPAAPAIQASVADQAATQPASLAQPADITAPAAAAVAPDQSQLIQSMARDLAAMGQQINELKASIEQIKASQPQAAREPAKAADVKPVEPIQLQRPKIVMPPARTTAAAAVAPIRKPKQVFPYAPIAPAPPLPPQAAAAALPQTAVAPAQAAPQAQTAEDGGPVVRPPMPLH